MTFDAGTWWLAVLLLGGLTALCGWLLKHTSDKNDKLLEKLQNSMVGRSEFDKQLDAVKKDIREIQRSYTTQAKHDKDFDECRQSIKEIRDNYLTKEDFLREQAKTERKLDAQDQKLDRILEILMSHREGAQ